MEPDLHNPTEAAWRRGVLDGDEDAWRCLYEAAFRRLYRHVYVRVGKDPQRTEDIVQESWMVAVRRIRTFDPKRCRFETWIHGIATNLLRNDYRSRARSAAHHEELSTDAHSAETPDDPPAIEQDEHQEQIAMAMTRLPPNYRTALRDRYEQEHTVAELAAVRGTTPKAVESLLARARRAFRDAYRKHRLRD